MVGRARHSKKTNRRFELRVSFWYVFVLDAFVSIAFAIKIQSIDGGAALFLLIMAVYTCIQAYKGRKAG